MIIDKTTKKTSAIKIGGRIVIDLSHSAYTTVATALKEYISNAWDAGANKITVRIFHPENISALTIEILDNGCGMTQDELENKFFRIGRDRRLEEGPRIKTVCGMRTIHGRKGLGKLAGLKMAKLLKVVSCKKASLEGAHISLDEIEKNPNAEPLIHWKKPSVNPIGQRGTLIRLEHYSRTNKLDIEELAKKLSLWFEFGNHASITLERWDGKPLKRTKQWKIARSTIFSKLKTKQKKLVVSWKENGIVQNRDVTVKWGVLDKGDTSVRSLISVFSGTRALSTDEIFDIEKGWTNMFGIYKLVAEFHADWLDQMKGLDPADIKREGINWDLHPALQSFREVGRKWLMDTCAEMAKTKKGKDEIRTKTEKLVSKIKRFTRWPESRRAQLINIVTNYASKEAIPIGDLDRIVELFAFVLENGALIQFLQSLKESGKKDIEGFMEFAADFTAVEITGLLQVTKSKLDLINQLAQLITDAKTTEVPKAGRNDITTFLARNPWIFDPELRIDHKNVSIKRIVLETEKAAITQINRLPKEYFVIRPDFVGYVGSSNNAVCIELKKPNHEMTKQEAQRILDYRAALLAVGTFGDIRIIAVSGTFSKEAETLLKSVKVELMHYASLFERGKNQLSEYIAKLKAGLEGLEPKENNKSN